MTISIVLAVICLMSEREGDDERPGAGGRRPGERRRHCTTDGVHHSDQREAHLAGRAWRAPGNSRPR